MKSQFRSELFIAIRLGPLIFSLLENVASQWFSHWRQFKTDVSLFKIPRLLWPLTLFVYYGDSNFLTMSLLKALDNSQLCSAYVGHNLLITRFKILLSQALGPCMQLDTLKMKTS